MRNKTLFHSIAGGFGTALLFVSAQIFAQDMALSDILVPGEEWQLVAEGYQFTRAACADAEGNFYFTDLAKGTTINKISTEGKLSVFVENAPKLSGLKFGPDGRLFGCAQGGLKQIVAFDKLGKMSVIASDVEPNDLIVSRKGAIYFTESGKSQVTYIDPVGVKRVGDKGISQPSGLTLSPDQGTLVVSDHRGTNLWAFRIQPNGTLDAKEPYMTVWTPNGKPESSSDGMTTDGAGRYYVASAAGIQVFDPTGRLCGILTKPQDKFLANLGFAGPNLEYLCVTCSDKIYRRKTTAHGVLFFQKQGG